MRGGTYAGLIAAAALALPSLAVAQDTDVEKFDFGGFRNVLPAGQGETVNAAEFAAFEAGGESPATWLNQLPLYNDLIYAAPKLKMSDLDTYFKPASFGATGRWPPRDRACRSSATSTACPRSSERRARTPCSARATRPRRTASS